MQSFQQATQYHRDTLTGHYLDWAALCHPRTSAAALTLSKLSQLLWAGTGITAGREGEYYRTTPSAGALYPIVTYVVAHRVEGLPAGPYHYRLVGA